MQYYLPQPVLALGAQISNSVLADVLLKRVRRARSWLRTTLLAWQRYTQIGGAVGSSASGGGDDSNGKRSAGAAGAIDVQSAIRVLAGATAGGSMIANGIPKFTDIVFIVGPNKERFPGHKFVFALRSPVFQALLFPALPLDLKTPPSAYLSALIKQNESARAVAEAAADARADAAAAAAADSKRTGIAISENASSAPSAAPPLVSEFVISDLSERAFRVIMECVYSDRAYVPPELVGECLIASQKYSLEVLRSACMERAHSFLRSDSCCDLLCESMSEVPGVIGMDGTITPAASASDSTAPAASSASASMDDKSELSAFAAPPSQALPSLLVSPPASGTLRLPPIRCKSIANRNIACALGRGTILHFVEDRIMDIIKSQAFLELPISVLLSILESSRLRIDEIQLFHAVVRWGYFQLKNSPPAAAIAAGDAPALTPIQRVLRDVLPYIRFTLIPMSVILSEIAPLKLLSDTQLVEVFTLINTPSHMRPVLSTTKTRSEEVGLGAAGGAAAAAPAGGPGGWAFGGRFRLDGVWFAPALFAIVLYIGWFSLPCLWYNTIMVLSLPRLLPIIYSLRILFWAVVGFQWNPALLGLQNLEALIQSPGIRQFGTALSRAVLWDRTLQLFGYPGFSLVSGFYSVVSPFPRLIAPFAPILVVAAFYARACAQQPFYSWPEDRKQKYRRAAVGAAIAVIPSEFALRWIFGWTFSTGVSNLSHVLWLLVKHAARILPPFAAIVNGIWWLDGQYQYRRPTNGEWTAGFLLFTLFFEGAVKYWSISFPWWLPFWSFAKYPLIIAPFVLIAIGIGNSFSPVPDYIFCRFVLTLGSVSMCVLQTLYWWYQVEVEMLEPLHGFIVHSCGFPVLEFFGSLALHCLRALLPIACLCVPIRIAAYFTPDRFTGQMRDTLNAFVLFGLPFGVVLEWGFRQLAKNATPFYVYALLTVIRLALWRFAIVNYLFRNRNRDWLDSYAFIQFTPFDPNRQFPAENSASDSNSSSGGDSASDVKSDSDSDASGRDNKSDADSDVRRRNNASGESKSAPASLAAVAAVAEADVPSYVIDASGEQLRYRIVRASGIALIGYELAMWYFDVHFPIIGLIVPPLLRVIPSLVVLSAACGRFYRETKLWNTTATDYGNQNAIQLLILDAKALWGWIPVGIQFGYELMELVPPAVFDPHRLHPRAGLTLTHITFQWRVYRAQLYRLCVVSFFVVETSALAWWCASAPVPLWNSSLVSYPFAIPVLAVVHLIRMTGPLLICRHTLTLLTTPSPLKFALHRQFMARAVCATAVIEFVFRELIPIECVWLSVVLRYFLFGWLRPESFCSLLNSACG